MSSVAERAIHCHRCGTSWCAPDGTRRGARWACGRCQEILADREQLQGVLPDPFVRRYGMRAGSLWGCLIGATWWLPAVLAGRALHGNVDAWAFLLLCVPGVATVYWLLLRRRGTPTAVWRGYLALGAGGYAWYLWALLATWLAPGRANLFGLAGFGTISVLGGGASLWWHARLVRRLPKLDRMAAVEWAPSEAAVVPGEAKE